MIAELRISRCAKRGLKWTFAIPKGELAQQAGDHVVLWTTRDSKSDSGYRLHWKFCQKSDKRAMGRGQGIGRNARMWKLTETGHHGLCHPTLYQPGSMTDIIEIPNFPSSRSPRKLFVNMSDGVYSALIPKWNNSLLSNDIIKATDKAAVSRPPPRARSVSRDATAEHEVGGMEITHVKSAKISYEDKVKIATEAGYIYLDPAAWIPVDKIVQVRESGSGCGIEIEGRSEPIWVREDAEYVVTYAAEVRRKAKG